MKVFRTYSVIVLVLFNGFSVENLFAQHTIKTDDGRALGCNDFAQTIMFTTGINAALNLFGGLCEHHVNSSVIKLLASEHNFDHIKIALGLCKANQNFVSSPYGIYTYQHGKLRYPYSPTSICEAIANGTVRINMLRGQM
ncbi:MAG: hypothetical protein ABIQ95_06250 [Bdellovibrionia bacterium]